MNAPDKLRVNVTQRDIDTGTRHDCWKCPIARAAIRATKAFASDTKDAVAVDGMGIVVETSGDETVAYPLPYSARDFVWRFDRHRMVKPLRFTATRKEGSDGL